MSEYGNDFVSASGYGTVDYNDWFHQNQIPGQNSGATYTTEDVTIATWHPPTPGKPPIPYRPPSPPEYKAVINSSWNTSARSIDPIGREEFVSFIVNVGVFGAMLGLAGKGKDGLPNNAIPHALLLDGAGVWVFENGRKIKKLRTIAITTTTLRIIRQPDNEIVYMVVTGSEVIFHRSELPASIGGLYGYGRLYSKDDIIKDAEITTGKLQYGKA